MCGGLVSTLLVNMGPKSIEKFNIDEIPLKI